MQKNFTYASRTVNSVDFCKMKNGCRACVRGSRWFTVR